MLSAVEYRRCFRRPMRILACLGLGTHLGFLYVVAALCATHPEWIVPIAFVGIVVVGNLVAAAGVFAWKRAEVLASEPVATAEAA